MNELTAIRALLEAIKYQIETGNIVSSKTLEKLVEMAEKEIEQILIQD